jgi:cell division inhibitor SepF
MSNWMKNTRTWLGLGTESYYDEYGDPDLDEQFEIDEPEETSVRPVTSRSARAGVRSVPGGGLNSSDDDDKAVRLINQPIAQEEQERGVVRPLPSSAKPVVVSPSGFNDVQKVADNFKNDQPVILNLQGVDRDLARRLIDFSSGLCYGLEGDMERVADQVFLLTPRNAVVSDDDRRRLSDGGLVDESR